MSGGKYPEFNDDDIDDFVSRFIKDDDTDTQDLSTNVDNRSANARRRIEEYLELQKLREALDDPDFCGDD